MSSDLTHEGPVARRRQIAKDEMVREMEKAFPKVDGSIVRDAVEKCFADKLDKAGVKMLLDEEQRRVVGKEFAADSGDSGQNKVVLYVTNQTGDRQVRYKCHRLRLSFVCLRLDWIEVDIAGNKWLRERLAKAAKVDEIPLVFMGLGADGKFVGDYESIIAKIDDATLYEHLGKFGYKHPHTKGKHFIFSGDTCRMKRA